MNPPPRKTSLPARLWQLVPALLVGALLGAALGYYRECVGGACPLHPTWWKGALAGAALGLILSVIFRRRPGQG